MHERKDVGVQKELMRQPVLERHRIELVAHTARYFKAPPSEAPCRLRDCDRHKRPLGCNSHSPFHYPWREWDSPGLVVCTHGKDNGVCGGVVCGVLCGVCLSPK